MGAVAGESIGPADGSPTTSLVQWGILGLVIERPSYVYDLVNRFERRYGSVLSLSNNGHAYSALRALMGRALIEEIPGTREGRQPKPHYKATDKGMVEYQAWLVSQAHEDRRRQQLFLLSLRALAHEPEQLLAVVARYEQAWVKEGMKTSIVRERPAVLDRISELFGRLCSEENRRAVGAKLGWAQYAREQIQALAVQTEGRESGNGLRSDGEPGRE